MAAPATTAAVKNEGLYKLFLSIGLEDKVAVEAANNKKLGPLLESLLNTHGFGQGCDRQVGNLVYQVSTTIPSAAHRGIFLPLCLKPLPIHSFPSPRPVLSGFSWFRTRGRPPHY